MTQSVLIGPQGLTTDNRWTHGQVTFRNRITGQTNSMKVPFIGWTTVVSRNDDHDPEAEGSEPYLLEIEAVYLYASYAETQSQLIRECRGKDQEFVSISLLREESW